MKNCLIKKLNVSVQDDMLPDMGYIQIPLEASSPCDVVEIALENINNLSGSKAKLLGDAYFVDTNNQSLGKELSLSGWQAFVTHSIESSSTLKGIHVESDAILELPYGCGNTSGVRKLFFDARPCSDIIDLNRLKFAYDSVAAVNQQFQVIADVLIGDFVEWMSKSKVNFTLSALVDGSQVVGSIDDVVVSATAPNSFFASGLSSITGNINGLLDKFAANVAETRNFNLKFTNCPLLVYNEVAIGNGFDKTFTLNASTHTWEEV